MNICFHILDGAPQRRNKNPAKLSFVVCAYMINIVGGGSQENMTDSHDMNYRISRGAVGTSRGVCRSNYNPCLSTLTLEFIGGSVSRGCKVNHPRGAFRKLNSASK